MRVPDGRAGAAPDESDARRCSGSSRIDDICSTTVPIWASVSMKFMAAYRGGNMDSDKTATMTSVAGSSVPCKTNRHPTGSTVTSVAGQMARPRSWNTCTWCIQLMNECA